MTKEEMAVLEAVEQTPMHVLHIHDALVKRRLRQDNVAGASTLYRVVRGLERALLLSSREEEGDEARGGRPRIIYTLTAAGRDVLAEARKPLPEMTDEKLAMLEQLAQAVREGRENLGELYDHLGAEDVLALIARVRKMEARKPLPAMNDGEVAALEQLAHAATPGPWHWVNPWDDMPRDAGAERSSLRTVAEHQDRTGGSLPDFIITGDLMDQADENAAFMAAANPAAVLALIALVRRAEDTVRKLRGRGGILANHAFNLKQASYVPGPVRESLAEAQVAWDTAVREAMGPSAGGQGRP